MLFCTLGAVTACGANEPQLATALVTPVQAVRVVVTFKQTQGFADKGFLDTLQQRASARFSYIAAISPLTHIYRMEPIAPQTAEAALAALQRWTTVQQVALDAKERN